MTNTRRVTSRIGRGLYMVNSRTHQYLMAGSRREGWTVNALERNSDGIPQSASAETIAAGLSMFNAEQQIINHWAKATNTVPPRQVEFTAMRPVRKAN